MSKGRFEVEKLDKGFKVCVYVEKPPKAEADKAACCMYPEMERFEAATESQDEIHKWIGQWLTGQKIEFEGAKPEGEVSKPKGSILSAGPGMAEAGGIY